MAKEQVLFEGIPEKSKPKPEKIPPATSAFWALEKWVNPEPTLADTLPADELAEIEELFE